MMRKSVIIISSFLVGFLFCFLFFIENGSQEKNQEAVAVVYPTHGNMVKGIVHFSQKDDHVLIKAKFENLTPGKHGFHIHAYGDCSCDDGTCAGDHFNPTNQPHGSPDNAMRHAGDLGNIEADTNGQATFEITDSIISLNGPHSIIGRSVIIHAQEDDLTSQPTGNAGARIGCGVIGIAKR